jgi:hypothetical protein
VSQQDTDVSEDLAAFIVRVKCMVLGSGHRCMRGRDICKPKGKWVKPACEADTGKERKKVKSIRLRIINSKLHIIYV